MEQSFDSWNSFIRIQTHSQAFLFKTNNSTFKSQGTQLADGGDSPHQNSSKYHYPSLFWGIIAWFLAKNLEQQGATQLPTSY
jgi:hypothetical protein